MLALSLFGAPGSLAGCGREGQASPGLFTCRCQAGVGALSQGHTVPGVWVLAFEPRERNRFGPTCPSGVDRSMGPLLSAAGALAVGGLVCLLWASVSPDAEEMRCAHLLPLPVPPPLVPADWAGLAPFQEIGPAPSLLSPSTICTSIHYVPTVCQALSAW